MTNLAFTLRDVGLTLLKVAFVTTLFFASYSAYAATLSTVPATGVYKAGQTFTAQVVVNTNGAPVNAADGTLTFNPKEVTVVAVNKGSIFSLWTADPAFSNANGTITFSGGSPSGYTGSSGTVISITLKATAAGSPKISFSKGSVLAADGKGTNVLTAMNGGAYTITANDFVPEPETIEYKAPANTPAAPEVKSSTHPDSSKWYGVKDVELSWTLGKDVTAVRTLLDENSGTIPTKVYDTPIDKLSIADLDDGVHYFHIQFKNSNGWGRVTHYRLGVDTQKPTSFDILLQEKSDLSNPVQTLLLHATDATSKVRRFSVQVDGADPYEYIDEKDEGSLALSPLQPGHHTLIIEAFDEAGNSIISTFSFDILAFGKPQFTEYPSEINEQVIPVIKGITKPNATVKITMSEIGLGVSSDASKKTFEVKSSDSGEFIFIPDGRLSLGVYELTAMAVDQYGAQSDPSDPIRIAVQQPGYLKIGSLVVSVLSVIIPLLGLVALLVLGVWFLLFRLRLLKRGVTREAKEAVLILSQEFDKIQQELVSQKAYLEQSRKTKKLTKAEADLIDIIAKSLKSSQNRVQKEIVDVEDLVD